MKFIKSQINRIRYRYINNKYSCRTYKLNNSNLFWWNHLKNFGDYITPYLFKMITGKEPVHVLPDNNSDETVIIGAGSIINWATANSIIWGSGVMSRNLFMQKPMMVNAVRGPLTRMRMIELGYDCPEIYGDPGLLLPRFYSPNVKKEYFIGVVPHYMDADIAARCFGDDIFIIDVLRDVEDVVNDIASCDLILSSSLHGCIIAYAYNIRSIWIEFSANMRRDRTKYIDYLMSIGMSIDSNPVIINDRYYSVRELMSLSEKYQRTKASLVDLDLLLNSCPFHEA